MSIGKVDCDNGGAACALCCSVVSTALAIAITFLVLGILGSPDIALVPMAPIGSRIMISLGVSFILGMVGTAIKCCAR